MAKSGLFAAVALAAATAACQGIPKEQTVAQYCAVPDHQDEGVCKLKVEIDGQSVALADTDMRLSEARNVADGAATAAAEAKELAAAAMARAEEAANKTDEVVCETRTIQNSAIGTCRPGFTLTSCTQTRYTYRAGGMSIMREINDQQCRFNSKVLEMQVRCCAAASSGVTPEDTLIKGTPDPVPAPEEPVKEESPLRY
ncbi:hypothetical protein [Hyphomonas jannaschiana]|jgi:hypothetical protein|uniref:Putative lipoprotein n=1 Tax=Hyphomonas jannaschiana VP2 TaxID=1280952 RepID=A0A059FKZ6_9PROT|nr:hypothetical protein [Hyphomonas jannaschiana]KCZ91319.1 putative lipoprotein [Hyphomonas jannaschiana VP2]MCA8893284.1 hypothetical protein [Hyphomonas sp.]